jgi:aliphatic sulfonates family ABC transporter substrate-binding protein
MEGMRIMKSEIRPTEDTSLSVLTLPQGEKLSLSVRAKALVFEDQRSRALLSRIQQVAPSNATVLIAGETGTGKEIVARHIHELSHRARRPFVAVNCGAFSESLIESDLFGHDKGAFTGAATGKAGWFEEADGGTLFLDEIGDLPLGAQVKLLRVLQEHEVVRLGSRRAIPVDVRLIAATNVRLEEAVAAGHFREDLFYRLAVAKVAVDALRDRPGDILPLARYFLEVYAARLGGGGRAGIPTLTPGAERCLLGHAWMGNIRELENAIHHALLVCRGGEIAPEDLPLITMPPRRPTGSHTVVSALLPTEATTPAAPVLDPRAKLRAALKELYHQGGPGLWNDIEEMVMLTAYEHSRENQLRTARLLGVSRNVVRARLLQFGALVGGAREGENPEEPATSRPRVKVRIGCLKLGPLTVMRINGRLARRWADRGIDVEWEELEAGPSMVEAISAGRLDLAVTGSISSIVGQADDVPLVCLAAEPPAPEGAAIVVHRDSPIRQVADLKGKTVALNRGSNSDYLVLKALEEAELDFDDVQLSDLPPGDAQAAFEHRDFDAWAIWNPVLAQLRQQSGARVLRDSSGMSGNFLCYVGTRAFTGAHPDLVDEFLQEVGEAGAWINENQAAAVDLLAQNVPVSRAAISAALSRRRFGARPVDATLLAAQQSVADTLLRANRIGRRVAVADAQWVPPLPMIATPAPQQALRARR